MQADRGAKARVLVIAGSDSGGGAGIQADLKTLFAHGVHGASAVAAVTVQNSLGVTGFYEMTPDAVAQQIDAVLDDIGADAIKTGMLASARIIQTVGRAVARAARPAVIDPVAASQHGHSLLRDDALVALKRDLLPMATVTTPNLSEVRLLTGIEVDDASKLLDAAKAVHALGPRWVLIKGGHLQTSGQATDLLYSGGDPIVLSSAWVDTPHTHGSGDTLTSALAARLALGDDVPTAARHAKRFVERAVAASYPLGAGLGPVDQPCSIPA